MGNANNSISNKEENMKNSKGKKNFDMLSKNLRNNMKRRKSIKQNLTGQRKTQ